MEESAKVFQHLCVHLVVADAELCLLVRATCQPSFKEKVLAGVEYCAVYNIDDVLVLSSWNEHYRHVKQVLLALKKAGLMAKPSKCGWGKSHLDYLWSHEWR